MIKKVKFYSSFVLQVANWQLDFIRHPLGYNVIHCFGDSHTHLFEYIQQHRLMSRTIIRAVKVGGATARGIANSNSSTQSLRIFQRYIQFVNKKHYILFMLGEIDCGYLAWYRADKYATSIDHQLLESITNYQSYLLKLLDRGYSNLIICSAPLPAILDKENWGDIAEETLPSIQRQQVKASHRNRTDLTFHYNQLLREFCYEYNIQFLDLEKRTLNLTTKLIDDCYRQDNPSDNHLRNETVVPVIIDELNKIGFT